MNDLWMFNVTSQIWTWVSGSDTLDSDGVYGTKGVSSESNHPGSRSGHSMVFHSSINCLLVFGGYGSVASSTYGMFPVILNHSNLKKDT